MFVRPNVYENNHNPRQGRMEHWVLSRKASISVLQLCMKSLLTNLMPDISGIWIEHIQTPQLIHESFMDNILNMLVEKHELVIWQKEEYMESSFTRKSYVGIKLAWPRHVIEESPSLYLKMTSSTYGAFSLAMF